MLAMTSQRGHYFLCKPVHRLHLLEYLKTTLYEDIRYLMKTCMQNEKDFFIGGSHFMHGKSTVLLTSINIVNIGVIS
jgi:hypothetical protein